MMTFYTKCMLKRKEVWIGWENHDYAGHFSKIFMLENSINKTCFAIWFVLLVDYSQFLVINDCLYRCFLFWLCSLLLHQQFINTKGNNKFVIPFDCCWAYSVSFIIDSVFVIFFIYKMNFEINILWQDK